ncbi:MAG: CotH kinase family protein [Myxococcota bacterium]|nr:CotH kinase family protein [Myxococcota bacterium]
MLLSILTFLACREAVPDGNFDPEHIVDVSLSIADADWEALCNQTRTFFSEFAGDCMDKPFQSPYTYFSADISIDGQSLSNIGVRKKGFIGSQSTVKPSLRINLDEYVDGAELFNVDNVTLNNGVQDPSRIRQCLGYYLFEKAGLPASRCNFARVSVNGNEPTIYIHVEPVKRSFLRDHFGNDDGDLYEGTISDFDPIRMQTFEVKNDDTDETLAPIQALTTLLQTESSLTEERLGEHVNIDAFLTFWAMEVLTGHWDGYTGYNNNNFFMYRDPSTQQFYFIPWGLDDVFDPGMQEGESYIFSSSALTNAILNTPELNPLFEEKMRSLLDTVWVEDEILAEIDRMEALLSSEPYMDDHISEFETLREYVEGHRAYVESALPAQPTERGNPYCIQAVGNIEASFETQWGSNDNENILEEGTLDMSVDFPNWTPQFLNTGAGIGFAGEPTRPDSALVLAGYTQDGVLLYPYLEFDSEQAAGGEIIIDQHSSFGSIYYTTEEMGYRFEQAGFLYGGTLSFETFGTGADETVIGTLSSEIYNWQEISD